MAFSKRPQSVFQLKIRLKGVRPPIWRRLLLSDRTRLAELHAIIQIAMGWSNLHPHQFWQKGGTESVADHQVIENERRVTLAVLDLGENDCVLYEYDFGDGWEHEVRVEKVLSAGDLMALHRLSPGDLPICVAGRRACPPESCGGPESYARMLQALADLDDAQHDEWAKTVGRAFNPEAFSLRRANEMLVLRRTSWYSLGNRF